MSNSETLTEATENVTRRIIPVEPGKSRVKSYGASISVSSRWLALNKHAELRGSEFPLNPLEKSCFDANWEA